MAELDKLATEAGSYNVAFTSRWLLGDVDGCIETLSKTGRFAEAALFAQTYKPSSAAAVVAGWKQSLEKAKKGRVAKLIGVPGEDEELFPEWTEWLELEEKGSSAEAAKPAEVEAAAGTKENGVEEEAAAAEGEEEEEAEEEKEGEDEDESSDE